MNFAKLTTLRNFARRLGITRLLSIRQRMEANRSKQFYLAHQPDYADISLLGYDYKLYTHSAYEWMRANAVYQDKHIIESLTSFLHPGDDAWDIGASMGAYTHILANKCAPGGTVYAFEPESESMEMLVRNLELNEVKNVHVYKLALGHTESELALSPSETASAGTHRLKEMEVTEGSKNQLVRVVTIDSLRKQDHLPVPKVLKIDVEGWEENVLLGGLETIKMNACRAIMVEIHFSIFAEQKDDDRAQRILDLLQHAGFIHLKWVDPSHLLAHK